jgi:asparagine synthase (glutamine-hydrolysing)
MCGIAGIVGQNVAREVLERMAAAMHHRGPDAGGTAVWEDGGFAHRRLSILDLGDSGHQPLSDERQRALIVFNGEIYNYVELRDELESQGVVFRSSGDTEVLLQGYLAWGVDVLPRLNGMFAFAIWDTSRRTLFVARDRMGKKPLFTAALTGGGLALASELKALLASGLVSTDVDPAAVADYLRINYVLGPKTILKGVRQVPPGHYGLWRAGQWTVNRYWDMRTSLLAPRLSARRETLSEELGALLDDAVRLRMRSDVPMGAFLSGGLDSSTIVATMRGLGADRLHTFSVESALHRNEDTYFSRRAAQHLRTIHHARAVNAPTLEDLAEFAWRADVPLGDDSTYSVYELSRWTKGHVTVALSGDGADEIFAGYPTYKADWLHRRLGPARGIAAAMLRLGLPLVGDHSAKLSRRFKLQRLCQGLRATADRAHYGWREVLGPDGVAAIVDPQHRRAIASNGACEAFEKYASEARGADWLDGHLYVDCQTWLVDDILAKVDRASMAASLEVRSPFLDYRVVEFAARLPREHKLDGWRTKTLLRDLAQKRLPSEFIRRGKEGFNSPTTPWMQTKLRPVVEEVLSSGDLAPFGVEWAGGVETMWRQFLAGRREYQYSLWGLFMLGLWRREVLGRASIPASSQRAQRIRHENVAIQAA